MKKKFFAISMASVLCSLTMLTGNPVDAASSQGTISNAEYLNVREKPSNNGKIITTLKKGTVVTVLDASGSWDYIQYGAKKGYIYDKYIKYNSTITSTTSIGTVVNAYKLNVRQSASANSKIVAVLNKSDKVTIISKNGNWYQIKTNGKNGYVNGKYINVSSVTNTSTSSSTNTTKPPTTSTSTNSSTQYKVKKGDTLYSISKSYNMSIAQLKALNDLSSNLIKVGQSLTVVTSNTPKNPTTLPANPTPPVQKSLSGKLIVLDPGHGDARPGAIANGLVEKTLNYDVSLKVKRLLEEKGATVKLTRIGDTDCHPGTYAQDLSCRANVANNVKADAFLSIHGNSGSVTATGGETFYYADSGKKLAASIQNSYIAETGLKSRRVAYGNYAVLRNNKVPAALIELAFLSNPNDAAKLKSEDFKNKAAIGIVKGFEVYFGK